MKILFLDIDGVLNDHGRMINMYCGIQKDKIDLLSQIINKTRCKIVISSAWRYMVLCGAMTLQGFEYMLITHGLKCEPGTIIGVTQLDEEIPTRGCQISNWLYNNKQVKNWVVVDDMQLDIPNHCFVQTNGKVGLTQTETDLIIAKLGEAKEV